MLPLQFDFTRFSIVSGLATERKHCCAWEMYLGGVSLNLLTFLEDKLAIFVRSVTTKVLLDIRVFVIVDSNTVVP